MLSSDILSQLSTLKKEIRASRDVAQGTVRGTSGRFGFVTLDDGRDAFLNPEQMDRVFDGDRVEVSVTQNDKEQYEAKLEKLIHSPLKQVAGRYCVKGKGHFVIYENQQHSRWLFVPPKERAQAKEGQYVTARVIQHPYDHNGKAQVKITQVLGDKHDAGIARKFTLAMHQLFEHFPKEIQQTAEQLSQQSLPITDTSRQDFRHLPFITIDAAATKDMDDALSIETTESGWLLHVAIADPGAEITHGSPLDTLAQRRGHTLYLPGKAIPMLPEILSTERYSLAAKQDRLALVCQLHITQEGQVSRFEFIPGVVQSHGKLSYQQVTALLNNTDYNVPPQLDNAEPFTDQIQTLEKCAQALLNYRKQHQLVTDYRHDYLLLVNNEGKLDSIEKLERTQAHTIVEEAMIATNQCAGQFLAENNSGLFTTHAGYREERRDDIEKLLTEKLGESGNNSKDLKSFITIIQTLQNNEDHQNLLAIQQRFHQGSELSTKAAPHFGLGANYYATITSPIRRYQDLYNQRCIFAILTQQKPNAIKNRQLERLKETLNNNRAASRFYEQWLIADYMQSYIGREFTGTIALLTNQGIGVRLNDNGAEGFIVAIKEDKDNPEKAFDKISFNNQRMELTWNETPLFLEQQVAVKLTHVDMERRKLALEWAEPIVSPQLTTADNS